MKNRSVIKASLTALGANKVRTGLTILGMLIGIASIVIVFSAGEGISSLILGQVEMFGTDIIQTEVKVPTGKKGTSGNSQSATALAQGVQITTLSMDDLEDVGKLANVSGGYAAITGQELFTYGNNAKKAMIFAVSASFINIDKGEIEYGRFFSEGEDKSLAKVVVLGKTLKEKLFADQDPIGKFITIHKSKYKVIGVMKERGSVMSFDYDTLAYLPVRTMQKRVMGINHILFMVHKLRDLDLADQTAEEARLIIRKNHDIIALPKDQNAPKTIGEGATDTAKDDFRTVTMQESLEVLSTVTDAITLLLLAIVAISLIVGGVGIMNIMYVVVSERTMEIGLRKAVGATYKDIMSQILIESIVITLLGGIIGILFGILVSLLIWFGANSYGLDWDFVVPLKAYVTALGFSLFFGIIFGLLPARKAARMQPIEALRKE